MKRTPLTLLLSAALSALLAVAGALVFAPGAAVALPVIGHGVGHLWAADGRSWLGSHRLADGQLGLCLQVQNAPPEGADVQYGHASTYGWYSTDDAARLAFIARTWTTAANPDTAAAAQLTAWGITGLGGHDQAWYAQRANGSAGSVLALAQQMRRQLDARGGASRGVVARLSLAVPSDAGGTVSSDLVVDWVGGGAATLPPATHRGTLTLSGATFADGSQVRLVSNGESLPITPSKGSPLTRVTADVAYGDLPYGADAYIAKAPLGTQSLLVPPARNTGARARAHAGDVSPLPFAPAVETQTSSAVAEVGAHLVDTLELALARGTVPKLAAGAEAEIGGGNDGDAGAGGGGGEAVAVDGTAGLVPPTTLDEWGVYRDGDGALQPVPVVIRSTLWGPFDEMPAKRVTAPPGAPVACRVQVRAADGPGTYETPDCVLEAPGYYVWTETIDPADTPAAQGGDRITAWESSFGAATEITRAVVPPPLPPVTETPPPTAPPTGTTPPVAPPSPTPSPTPGVLAPPASPPAARGEASLASTGLGVGTAAPWLGLGAAALTLGLAALASAQAAQRTRRRRV